MSNPFFKFKQFTIRHEQSAMKVTTDACLFGAWVAERMSKDGSMRKEIVLDIGTGTGLLAIMLAQKTNYLIDAIELDQPAFEEARENARATPWGDRLSILHGDVKQFDFSCAYDFIISNPPFYEGEWIADNEQKNLARHGVGLKWDELLEVIGKNLSPNGHFFLLLPFKRNNELQKLFEKQGLEIVQRTLVRQSASHGYFRIMLEGRLRKEGGPADPLTDEILIWNDKREYSPAFIELLKDYYLYLEE